MLFDVVFATAAFGRRGSARRGSVRGAAASALTSAGADEDDDVDVDDDVVKNGLGGVDSISCGGENGEDFMLSENALSDST